MKKVWFSHGKIIDGLFCPFCDRHRSGRLIRDRHLWRAILKCGHVRSNLGLTQPYEELERKGYINPEFKKDPRQIAKEKQAFREFMNEKREAYEREVSLTSNLCL